MPPCALRASIGEVGDARRWHGLTRNAFRAGLSMLGISWGIVSVVMLLAYGNGFHDGARAPASAAPSATASRSIWPGQTSMQAGGERAGKRVRLQPTDVAGDRRAAAGQARQPGVHRSDCPMAYGNKQAVLPRARRRARLRR